MFRVEKNRNSLHHLQRSTKTQQEEFFWKKDIMKNIQNIGFGLGFCFDLTM
jgi:hypothetical protein